MQSSTGKPVILIGATTTGQDTAKYHMRPEYRDSRHESIDAPCFLPAGSTVGDDGRYCFYAMAELSNRAGIY